MRYGLRRRLPFSRVIELDDTLLVGLNKEKFKNSTVMCRSSNDDKATQDVVNIFVEEIFSLAELHRVTAHT